MLIRPKAFLDRITFLIRCSFSLDPLLGLGHNGDPHDEQDGQPGDHGVEQHQRHTEGHPGGVTQG